MKIQHLLNEVQDISGIESDTVSFGDLSDIQKSVLAKLSSGAISYDSVSSNTKRTIDELETLGLVYLGDVTESGEKMVDIYNELNDDDSSDSLSSDVEPSSFDKVKDELRSYKDAGLGDDDRSPESELRF